MKPIYVKPADDTSNPERAGRKLIVRDPDRGFSPLPDEGMHVMPTQYWMTMLRDGSVIQCEPPETRSTEAAPSAAASNNKPRRAGSH